MEPRETMRRLPRFTQPFLTWLTGIPLAGERPLIRWTPAKAATLAFAQIAIGITIGAFAWSAFAPWTIPLLLLSWLTTAGGMRRFDVVIVHQSLHRMVTRSARGDRIVGEFITTVLWRVPYDDNRKEHLIHHAFPCSMKDIDTRYLIATGMKPRMQRGDFHRYLLSNLLSPKHHWGFLSGRLRANFSIAHQPRYRLAMSLAFLGATVAFLAITGLWREWLVLWVVPVSFFFQNATFLYTLTEHRWWLFNQAEQLTREERDGLTFCRVVGDPAPVTDGLGWIARAAAWTTWWLRALLVHAPYRMFVLVGDTVQHDLHHVRPSCNWANSAYERHADLARGSKRYTAVWGSLMDHLYAAGDVQGHGTASDARGLA
jgi:fatty acid desaturase